MCHAVWAMCSRARGYAGMVLLLILVACTAEPSSSPSAPTTEASSTESPHESAPVAATESEEAPLIHLLAVKHTAGTMVCFEVGDYTHAVIRHEAGEEKSYWLGEISILYFLAVHRNQPLDLTYEVRDVFIPEAGERMETETLTEATAGDVTANDWWLGVVADKGSPDAAEASFEEVFLRALCEP